MLCFKLLRVTIAAVSLPLLLALAPVAQAQSVSGEVAYLDPETNQKVATLTESCTANSTATPMSVAFMAPPYLTVGMQVVVEYRDATGYDVPILRTIATQNGLLTSFTGVAPVCMPIGTATAIYTLDAPPLSTLAILLGSGNIVQGQPGAGR